MRVLKREFCIVIWVMIALYGMHSRGQPRNALSKKRSDCNFRKAEREF